MPHETINPIIQPNDGHHDAPKNVVVASPIASYIIKLVVLLTVIHLFTLLTEGCSHEIYGTRIFQSKIIIKYNKLYQLSYIVPI